MHLVDFAKSPRKRPAAGNVHRVNISSDDILKPKVAKMQICVSAFPPPSVAKCTHATFEFEVYVRLLKILLTRQENSPRREN